jgi:hypothetical protein
MMEVIVPLKCNHTASGVCRKIIPAEKSFPRSSAIAAQKLRTNAGTLFAHMPYLTLEACSRTNPCERMPGAIDVEKETHG